MQQIINAITAFLNAFFGIKVQSSLPPVMPQPIIKTNPITPMDPIAQPATPVVAQTAPTKTTVVITRNTDNGRETIGTLVATRTDGQTFTCKVLERPWLDNQHDVSCIPAGTYDGIYTYQGDLKENHYELQAVPNRDGIFQHEGDFYFNSLGCQLLGVNPSDINADGQIDVTSSKPTVKAYEEFCEFKPIIITVIAVQK